MGLTWVRFGIGLVWYWFGMVWYGLVWFGMVWYGLVWYGLVWYGLICFIMDEGLETFPGFRNLEIYILLI